MKYWVYIHTCPNGKRYVGCTRNLPEVRWKEGRGYGSFFQDDIQKYGWDNITHEVFEVDSEEEMYRKEVELISFYHSNDPKYGYNIMSGGPGGGRLPEWYKQLKLVKQPKPIKHFVLEPVKHFVVELPDGRTRIMSRTEAFRYFRNYYNRHPLEERKGPNFLREVTLGSN